MSPEDGAFAKHLMTPEVLTTLIWPVTLIILAFILCIVYLMHEIIQFCSLYLIISKLNTKPDTEKSNIYIGRMINSPVSNRQKQSYGKIGRKCVQVLAQLDNGKMEKQMFKYNKSINTEQQQLKRKPKMSKPSSAKKEEEELLQESLSIQLLSQISDMTKSLINDTREIIKMLDQNEGTSKNSTECISTELAALQKQKESQSFSPDSLSNEKNPGSLEGFQDCINQTNSHESHSTNALNSIPGEHIKHDVDVPKEVAPLLKNNCLRRITYDFNEIQSSTELSEKPLKEASNTNSDSNISTSTNPYTLLITLALNFFLILRGYGVNLFLYFPFINIYSRISNPQKQSFGKIGGVGFQVNAQIEGKMEKHINKPISTQPEKSAKKK